MQNGCEISKAHGVRLPAVESAVSTVPLVSDICGVSIATHYSSRSQEGTTETPRVSTTPEFVMMRVKSRLASPHIKHFWTCNSQLVSVRITARVTGSSIATEVERRLLPPPKVHQGCYPRQVFVSADQYRCSIPAAHVGI